MGVLVRNVSAEDTLAGLTIPTRPDGSYYRYEMICDGGWSRLYDDSLVGLLTHLIPGYTRLDDAGRLAARTRHAVDTQVLLQSRLNVFFNNEPRTPEQTTVLFAPRHTPPVVDTWTCAVPLILVDSFYQPYTATPRPITPDGDVENADTVWWLRPAEGDMEYLRSLHEASVIDLNMMKDEVR